VQPVDLPGGDRAAPDEVRAEAQDCHRVQPRPERDQPVKDPSRRVPRGLRRVRVRQHDPPTRRQQSLDVRQRCLQVWHVMQRHDAEHQVVVAGNGCLQQVGLPVGDVRP
jgi:hypothetical protein